MSKLAVIITGPTGVGKTLAGIELASMFNTCVISADSRQIYKEIPVGTGAPTPAQQAIVPHYLVGTKSIHDYYNAWEFEQEALEIGSRLFEEHNVIFIVGGSMMYVDVFCNGIDDLPTVDPELREDLQQKYKNEGLESMRGLLKLLDPEFYNLVDLRNPKRVIHALEICLMTGKPYSSLLSGAKKPRPFGILKIGLNIDRNELYHQINLRVVKMINEGLEAEALSLHEFQGLNALNTVGFKEMFGYFNGHHDMEMAISLIQRNTRHYAKKQLSWLKRDEEIKWFHPGDLEGIIKIINHRARH